MIKTEDKNTEKRAKTALIAVDVQNDFLPDGALGVPSGDQVVEPLLDAANEVDLVVASRDWHPGDHMSFEANGGIWPVHCVAETEGAALHPEIEAIADIIIDKATETEVDAYSAFQGTGLAELLRDAGVERVLVGGLATDYCVKATALDGIEAGFEVEVLADAARAVNVNPGDGEAALREVAQAGAEVRRGDLIAGEAA